MKLTPREARKLQRRLEEIAAEIKAATQILLAAADKRAAPAKQEQTQYEQEKT
jgi:hypothetical protein